MATRFGVDVGGTFTDLIFYDDDTGEVRVAKEPTTPAAPEEGVGRAVRGAVPNDLVKLSRFFLHGSTVGLNALLERKGAAVGLLATRGFRDTLEIRRGDRDEMYNLFWAPPLPLVPRHLRIAVTERVTAGGAVLTPLEPDDVRAALAAFNEADVTAIAVAFLNAYANPTSELRAEEVLRNLGFGGEISLSHRISGEYREYERTCTTVVDAYIRRQMTGYLERLEHQLDSMGFAGSLLVTRSGGGSMTFSEAQMRPFECIQSGPVAGVEGTAELARSFDFRSMITADVGGTSFDTSLIIDGRPAILYEGRVAGLPLQTPWVDVRSIGAGGGSIAYVDVGGLLRVGPESAGADPGPVSYGRGGTEPTVTDAAFVLGMLGDGELAAGIRLDGEKARSALAPLGDKLKVGVEELAQGVITIVTSNMANAIREITIERGQDPREAALMAFGGAGPVFATLLARELDVTTILIPPFAGNFSAWGLLGSDLTRTAARTRILKLDDAGLGEAQRTIGDLFSELETRTSGRADDALPEIGLDMRYRGQEHTLTVRAEVRDDTTIGADAEHIREQFTEEYRRTFELELDEEVEIVAVRATLRTPLPRRASEQVSLSDPDGGRPKRTMNAYSFVRGAWMPFDIIRREALNVDATVSGPAIIVEQTATTYLDESFIAAAHPSGCLFITQDSH